jgi:mannose-6-phosphate isomerase-like protein (cupin superfamily)
MQIREEDVELGPGDLLVVPKGVEHCPRASEVCELLLIEPFGTPNTGDVGGDRTAPEERLGERPAS